MTTRPVVVLADLDGPRVSHVYVMLVGGRTAHDVTSALVPAGITRHVDALTSGDRLGVPTVPSRQAIAASLVYVSTNPLHRPIKQLPAALAAYLKGA